MSEFVSVANYLDLTMAYIARSKLEDAGIACHLTNEYLVGATWIYSNAVGGIDVCVHAEDAEDARLVLSQEPYEPSEENFADDDLER